MSDSSPAAKRVKVSNSKFPTTRTSTNTNTTSAEDLDKVAKVAWQHYGNYVTSVEKEATGGSVLVGEGDMDELEELVTTVLKPYMDQGLLQPMTPSWRPWTTTAEATTTTTTTTTVTLLPILISVAYYHLADSAIAECLEYHASTNDPSTKETNQTQQEQIARCQYLIEQSLHWFSQNAAMWSMGANFGRMLRVLQPQVITAWYQHAIQCAVELRHGAMVLLEEEEHQQQQQDSTEIENENDLETVKEWIEMLLLNQICAVDYMVDDNDNDNDNNNVCRAREEFGYEEDDDDDDEEEELEDTDLINDRGSSCNDDNGYYSTSAVEATSRFMVAMMLSTAGKHDQAYEQLQHFDLTHCIHPNVWQPPPTTPKPLDTCSNNKDLPDNNNMVVAYHAVDNDNNNDMMGLLPNKIFQKICQVFSPQAPYWNESDYNHRGYYSYFTDMPTTTTTTKNNKEQFIVNHVIDDVIWNHMYPLVVKQQQQASTKNNNSDKEEQETRICGAEWWVHTRPVQANLGHNLHFDTDEALLEQEGSITHPLYSTVLYLTGGNAGSGATIVLDQTPDSQQVATKAWRCVPKDNTLLVFPGNLLHGVLPCPGESLSSSQEEKEEEKHDRPPCSAALIHKQWIPSRTSDSKKNGKHEQQQQQQQQQQPHRLTFMVGFWTRRVPDKMKNRKLYGPCGPLPPRPGDDVAGKGDSNEEDDEDDDEDENKVHSWVDEIHQGYDKFQPQSVSATSSITLPVISPAWDIIGTRHDDDGVSDDQQKMLLEIPKPIDHRFFVLDAPKCFRDSLFEREEEDDDESEESYEVQMVEVQPDNE
jgi:hypothetical protein